MDNPNILVIGIERAPENFDPRFSTDSTSQKLNKLIYSGLLKKDKNMEMVPNIALSVERLTPTRYRFQLKPNIQFHNHEPLTSEDVKATYLSMMSDKIQSPYQGRLSVIESIETPDKQTVIFNLNKAHAPFLGLLGMGILPKSYVDRYFEDKQKAESLLSGSGPYQLFQKNIKADSVTLIANPNFFGPKAKTKKLEFRVIQDATLRTMELLKGRIDFTQNNLPYVLIDYLKKQPEVQVQSKPGINFTYLAFNLQNPYLKNLKVRQAIAYAIDRDRIIKYKLAGLAQKSTSLMSPMHWSFNSDLTPVSFNLEKAKQLLDQTEFKDPDGNGPKHRFKLVYKTSSVKERIEIAQLIAENLSKIGIDIEIQSFEFGTFYRDIKNGSYDIYTLTWNGITEPYIYDYVFHSKNTPPNGANRGFYNNANLDQLLDHFKTILNMEDQKPVFNDIQKIVYDDFVYVPLWHEDNFFVAKKSFRGFALRADAGFIPLTQAYKE